MKFTVTMKDPDALYDCLTEAVEKSISDVKGDDEREAIKDIRYAKLRDYTYKWFRYGEYLNVEIDTEAGTATVLEAHP